MNTRILLVIFTFSSWLLCANSITLDTIFGPLEESDPLVIELVESQPVQRMKKIDQCGINTYFGFAPPFKRYDHLLGVYYLLKKYNASYTEQIAGLLHDISHTVFSHVGDRIFDQDDRENPHSYQDSIHLWYLSKCGIADIVKKYDIALTDLLPDLEDYSALEQELPDLCIDRIEYIIHHAVQFGMITLSEIHELLDDLHFENNKWYFSSLKSAKILSEFSLHFTEELFTTDLNVAIYKFISLALKQAINAELVTHGDLHFSNDEIVLEKLVNSDNPLISCYIKACRRPLHFAKACDPCNANYSFIPKFRGINPLVKVGNRFFRLTTLDADYAGKYITLKKKLQKGSHLKLSL